MTVCPPKDTNTALYHDLVKADNSTLSDQNRTKLREFAEKVILEAYQRRYVKKMLAISNIGNMDQVYQGFHSLPKPYQLNGFEIKMWNLNGTITSPYYGGDFVEDYYKEDIEIHPILDLPNDVKSIIGFGSLQIELEVDKKNETGWLEQVFHSEIKDGAEVFQDKIYTLHATKRNWTEAEAECQKDEGHLASVTSTEMNRLMQRLGKSVNITMQGNVWLGGKKKNGVWGWSDGSTWDKYTNWYDYDYGDYESYSDKSTGELSGDCVTLSPDYGRWIGKDCSKLYYSICQSKYSNLRETENVRMTYKKGHLDITSFHVWYKLKAADQHLLNRLKDKRQSNGWLDGVSAFTSYKQFWVSTRKWSDADALCKSEGGLLASIHSEREQTMARRAADGYEVWLGGSFNGSQWQWANNRTWVFENWQDGDEPHGGEHLIMNHNGQWEYADGVSFWQPEYLLCQGLTADFKESGPIRLEFNKGKVAFFPLHVTFQGRSSSQRLLKITTKWEGKVSGFSINWFLTDSNGAQSAAKLPQRQADWKTNVTQNYKHTALEEMVKLASHLRNEKNMSKEQILDKVIRDQRQSITTLSKSSCAMNQIKSELFKREYPKLVSNVPVKDWEQESITQEDKVTGFEIFHAVVYCSSSLSFDFKLFSFVDQLFSLESPRTIIQTFNNMFNSGVVQSAHMEDLYFALATTLRLQFENILLATSTKSQLQTVINNGWPFFINNIELVKTCLLESNCTGFRNLIQELGDI